METMYDKLGDLLSQTLAEGKVKFVKVEKTQAAENSDSDIADERKKLDDDLKRSEQNARKRRSAFRKSAQKKNHSSATVIKSVDPEIQRAMRLLDINEGASRDEITRAYKKKLMYFHPDRYASNPVLEKVATKKTEQIIEAYKLILGRI